MTLTFVAKLRWMPKRPNEQMIIRNFEAMRLMAMSIQHEKSKEWPERNAAEQAARQLLDEELTEYLSGQQITLPMATGCEGYGFSDIGGVH